MPLNDEQATAVLLALLWSPPDAAWDASGLVATERGHELAASLLAAAPSEQAVALVKEAARRAAAADYLPGDGPHGHWKSWTEMATSPEVGHPFATDKAPRASVSPPGNDHVARAVRDCRDRVKDQGSAWQVALAVWRFLPDLVSQAPPPGFTATDGAWWRRSFVAHPAYPDAVETVGALRAAVAATTDPNDRKANTAILVFSLASVQEYIGEARRTQDLWMGSYLYAYLIWHAIRPVIAALGPWSIITPSLRAHPLVDLWLANQGLTIEQPPERLRAIASLPNIFSAVVPLDRGEEIAKSAIASMETARNHVASVVRKHVATAAKRAFARNDAARWAQLRADESRHKHWLDLWDRQIEELALRDAFWVLVPWATPDEDRTRLEVMAEPSPTWAAWKSAVRTIVTENVGPGAGFPLASDLAARLHNSRKNRREFGPAPILDPPPTEPAPQSASDSLCTLCAARTALRPRNLDAAAFWQELANVAGPPVKLQGRIRHGERLCAPCAMKRLAGDAYFDRDRAADRLAEENDLAFDRHRFPSTATVATAPFRERLLAALRSGEPKVKETLKAWLDAVDAAVSDQQRVPANIPNHLRAEGIDPALKPLDSLDGSWFDATSYRQEAVLRELGVEVDQSLLDTAARKWRALRSALDEWTKQTGQPRPEPARYYAVLALDGDHIGNWLRGEFNPTFGDLLGRDRRAAVTDKTARTFGHVRPPGPLSQMALAAAGHAFALSEAPNIVEQRGWLIYAGGDDVLALAPRETAFGLARDLERAFRRWATDEGELLLGDRATMSAAIVIAHVNDPLGNVIREANSALKHLAKATYGRNAFVVSVLKRSGPAFAAGLPWRVEAERAALDAGADFDTIRRAIAGGVLSRGLITDVRHRQEALGAGAPTAPAGATGFITRMLLALAARHVVEDEQRTPGRAEILGAVERLFLAAEAALATSEFYPRRQQPARPTAWDVVVDLLRAAEFLAREDKE